VLKISVAINVCFYLYIFLLLFLITMDVHVLFMSLLHFMRNKVYKYDVIESRDVTDDVTNRRAVGTFL